MLRRSFNKKILSIILAWGLSPSIVFANSKNQVLSGELLINKQLVNGNIDQNLNDGLIETNEFQSIINIENDFYLIRPNTKLKFVSNRLSEIIKGSIHAVFGKRKEELKVKMPQGTIGIRGTSIFVDLEPKKKRSYFCTCYGETLLYDKSGKLIKSTISTDHVSGAFTDDGKFKRYGLGYLSNTYARKHAGIFDSEMEKAGCKVENSHCVLL